MLETLHIHYALDRIGLFSYFRVYDLPLQFRHELAGELCGENLEKSPFLRPCHLSTSASSGLHCLAPVFWLPQAAQ
jgi:hypothetical protein